MTQNRVAVPHAGTAIPPVPPRTEVDVLLDQLRGIVAWTSSHPPAALAPVAGESREARLSQARYRDVVERQRQGLIDWTTHQLRTSAHLLRSTAAARVVVVHRSQWFKGKVTTALEAHGISVVADLENGAEAIGVVTAEQPDVLLVEGKLPMASGLDVTRAARRFAPSTVVLAQVESEADIVPILDAGARTAYTRRVPPADVAADLVRLFAGS